MFPQDDDDPDSVGNGDAGDGHWPKGAIPGAQALVDLQTALQSGSHKSVIAHGLVVPQVAPGRVVLVAGPPGVGKTSLVMGVLFDIVARHPEVRAVVTNVEMSPRELLRRELSRIAGVPIDDLESPPEGSGLQDRVAESFRRLKHIVGRVCFAAGGMTLDQVARIAKESNANVVVVDWIQRVRIDGVQRDLQSASSRRMELLRQIADDGAAVVALAAVSRGHDGKGRSTYGGVGYSMASLRDSSEYEFGADDVWTLSPIGAEESGEVLFAQHKARYGEKKQYKLGFVPPIQKFTVLTT